MPEVLHAVDILQLAGIYPYLINLYEPMKQANFPGYFCNS
jgi:hypothetical protein